MDDKEKLEEAEAQIIENTLRWITWAIEVTRTGNMWLYEKIGSKRSSILSQATIVNFTRGGPTLSSNGGDVIFDSIYSGLWKDIDDNDVKTNLASDFYELEILAMRIILVDENIKELREVQKILFSRRNKKLEEAIKYIDQMYDENDDIFEKKKATTKIEAKKTDYAIEVSHKNAIDTGFRMLALKLHPDKGGDAKRFKILQDIRDYLLRVDLEKEITEEISKQIGWVHNFQVLIEEDFQVVRKLLQGKSIPKNWAWGGNYGFVDEKSIKKMADDGVDTSPFL